MLASPAVAQVAPGQGLPTREEVRPPIAADTRPPARLTVEGGIERAPCPLAEPRYAEVKVTLTQVVFDDLTAVDPAALAPAWSDYVGKSVPVSVVCDVRDAAATILRRKGYLAAIQVPPQRIENGVLHLQVLMARLVDLKIRGETGKSEALLARYLEPLKSNRPFNAIEAERALLLARDLPGYAIKLTLRPAGTVPGEVVGDVVVTHIPYTLDVSVQDYGTGAVGRWSGFVRGQAFDLLGLGDRLTASVFNTFDWREQTVVQGGYDLRIGGGGLTLGGNVTYAWTRPTIGGGNPLTSHTLVANVELGYPVVRTQAATLRAAGGFDLIDQRLKFSGAPLTTDQLRVLYARADYELIDRASIASRTGFSAAEARWRIAGALELRKGLSILGASKDCGAPPLYAGCAVLPARSRLDGDPQAGILRYQGAFEYRPLPELAFAISPSAQYAFDPLLSYEEFSGGNYTVGRGYDPGAIVGDHGAGFAAEIRALRLAPSGPGDVAIQPYAFLDAAWVWNKGAIPLPGGNAHLLSVGGGIRAAYGDRARLDLAIAAPLQRTYLQPGRDVRFLLSFTTRILPWRPL